jgi:hypothetical protein
MAATPAVLKVTVTKTVKVKDVGVANYIAALIEDAGSEYAGSGYTLEDIGEVEESVSTEVVTSQKETS